MAKPSILIVEDDPTWQNIFAEIVSDAGFKPFSISTYRNALSVLAEQTFSLAIVDISLVARNHADRGGVKILKTIADLPAGLPAIVVTGYATVDLAVETLVELNAVHFFRKDKFDRRKLLKLIKKTVLKPGTPQAKTARPDRKSDILKILSNREQEVLALLIQGQTNKQIGDELAITVNTVKKHVQSIFTKFNVDNRAAAVAKALGQR